MSASAKTLSGLFGMTEFMLPMVLDDLTNQQAYARPRGDGGPSIAWSIGHLLNYRVFMLNRFGVEQTNPWEERFGNVPATDGSGYPSLDDFRVAWDAVSADFMAALGDLTDEQLEGQLEDGGHEEQVLRDQVVFFAWHEGYHMGAIGQIRKELGLLGPAERVMALRAETESTSA
jgi:uncharacterized damage-inducible protein DinB